MDTPAAALRKGVGPDHPASFEAWLEFVPAEDRHLVEAHYPDHLVDQDLLCRVVSRDGRLRATC